MPMRIVESEEHPARRVDPFGRLPCAHSTVLVHITDAKSLGEDIVECKPCGYAMRLADLYRGLFPEGGPPLVPMPEAPARKTAKKPARQTAKKKKAPSKKASRKKASGKKSGEKTPRKK